VAPAVHSTSDWNGQVTKFDSLGANFVPKSNHICMTRAVKIVSFVDIFHMTHKIPSVSLASTRLIHEKVDNDGRIPIHKVELTFRLIKTDQLNPCPSIVNIFDVAFRPAALACHPS